MFQEQELIEEEEGELECRIKELESEQNKLWLTVNALKQVQVNHKNAIEEKITTLQNRQSNVESKMQEMDDEWKSRLDDIRTSLNTSIQTMEDDIKHRIDKIDHGSFSLRHLITYGFPVMFLTVILVLAIL